MSDTFSAEASEEQGSFAAAAASLRYAQGCVAGGYHGPRNATTTVGKGQCGLTDPREATPGSGPCAQDTSQSQRLPHDLGVKQHSAARPYSLALSSPSLSDPACAGLSTNPYSQQVTTAASLLRLQRLRCRRKLCPTI